MVLKNNIFCLFIYFLNFFLNTLNAQEFKNLYSTYTDQSIDLDGKDDEEFWNQNSAGDHK